MLYAHNYFVISHEDEGQLNDQPMSDSFKRPKRVFGPEKNGTKCQICHGELPMPAEKRASIICSDFMYVSTVRSKQHQNEVIASSVKMVVKNVHFEETGTKGVSLPQSTKAFIS